ncbi:MAG: M50 family metallopeptidase [Elusimicrobiaceae bacterium]|nr:M50 family metallopeptidase [Elusimicrobiaceae bacterium]
MNKWIKLLIAILLMPTVFWVGVETVGAFFYVLKDFQVAVGLLAGAALYCVIHFGGYKFERMYVWAHETTHAVAALLCGYRVHSITVNKDNGHVTMDRYNTMVVLAPYFVPFYAILTGFLYLAVDLFVDAAPYRSAFVFVVGFFMAFHFVQTFQTLWEVDQPDLKLAGGRVFSAVMIILCNALVLVLVLKLLFPQRVHLLEMAATIGRESWHVWKLIFHFVAGWFSSNPSSAV